MPYTCRYLKRLEKMPYLPVLELQAVVSHITWMLGLNSGPQNHLSSLYCLDFRFLINCIEFTMYRITLLLLQRKIFLIFKVTNWDCPRYARRCSLPEDEPSMVRYPQLKSVYLALTDHIQVKVNIIILIWHLGKSSL